MEEHQSVEIQEVNEEHLREEEQNLEDEEEKKELDEEESITVSEGYADWKGEVPPDYLKDFTDQTEPLGKFKDLDKAVQATTLAGNLKLIKKLREWFGLPRIKEPQPPNELEKQILVSMEKLMTILQDCNEAVGNVRIATMKSESQRLRVERESRRNQLLELEKEDKIASEKYNKINRNWQRIMNFKDPLNIHTATNEQQDKCIALLERKDAVINKLKKDIKKEEKLFLTELLQQEDEIHVLIDRIDEQLVIVANAYRQELDIIEEVTVKEKTECLERNRERWSELLKEKDDLEEALILHRYELVDEYEKKFNQLLWDSQESVRHTKVKYQKLVRDLTLKVEEMRGLCDLNKQKLKYNYDILLKREEESRNTLARLRASNNSFSKIVEQKKKKTETENAAILAKTKKIKKDIDFFLNDFHAIDKKADIMGANFNKKYFKLWTFNQKVADDLIKKIADTEKVIYEKLLEIPWEPPEFNTLPLENVVSYNRAKKIIKDEYSKTIEKESFTKLRKGTKEELSDEDLERRRRILKLLFDKICKNTNFLIQLKSDKFMETVPLPEKKLIRIDNVLSELGIVNENDMILFSKYLMPYLRCEKCDGHITEESIQTIAKSEASFDDELSDVASLTTERGVLATISKNTSSRFSTVCDVIYKELCTKAEEVPVKKDEPFLLGLLPGKNDVKFANDPEGVQRTLENQKLFGLDKTVERKLPLAYKNKEELCEILAVEKPVKQEKSETTDSYLIPCNDDEHTPVIPNVCIIRVLRDFMLDYNNVEKETRAACADIPISKERYTMCRLMDDNDVEKFWNRYKNVYTEQKYDLWNTMEYALKDYFKVLQRRHKLNQMIIDSMQTRLDLQVLVKNYAHPRRKYRLYDDFMGKLKEALGDPIIDPVASMVSPIDEEEEKHEPEFNE